MRYQKSYSGDPYWITARRAGTCAHAACEETIRVGDRAFYYPRGKAAYAVDCGHGLACAEDFRAAAEDEAGLGG